MPIKARIYVALTALVGGSFALASFSHFQSADLLRFFAYMAVAMLASGFKVMLPGINGSMSVNFLFILIGIAELTLPETLAIAAAAALVQSFWGLKRRWPNPVHLLFNLSSMAIAVRASFYAYHLIGNGVSAASSLALVGAACVYFVMNTVPVAVVVSLAEKQSFQKLWSECYFWSFPYYLVGAALAAIKRAANNYVGWETSLLVVPLVYWIYRSYRLYLGRLEDEKRHVEEVASLHLRTIEALALAIEAKDHATHDHLKRVGIYALEIGKDLGLSPAELDALRAASMLHDIGKLAVPEHILNKPGRLTAEEFEKMKIHPVVGAEILERVNFPYPVAPIVRAHHEKWDGSGYPNGIRAEEIPIGARILSAVDCLDALASHRSYRPALPLDQAMAEVAAASAKYFDPKVVDVLQRRYLELEQMATSQVIEPVHTLSTQVKVVRGAAPDAGLEESSPKNETQTHFLSSIAAASQEAQALFELSHELGNSLSLDETLSMFAVRLRRLVPYDSIAVYVCRDERLTSQYVNGDNFRLFSTLDIPLGQGLAGWVAGNRKPILNGNPAVEHGYKIEPGKHTLLQSTLAVPLEAVHGVAGVLALYSAEADAFTRDHLRVLQAISSKVAFCVENALKYQQAESSATTDYLTGLPNARSLFLHLDRELARCRRARSSLAVMVCDLNGFKAVNDRFGHLEGNRVLQVFADLLRAAWRNYDYIARMGGDEFVVVAPGMPRDVLDERVARLNELAEQAGVQVCGSKILSLSVGAAFYGVDGQDAEQLLAAADRRMYIVKQEHHERLGQLSGMPGVSLPRATVN